MTSEEMNRAMAFLLQHEAQLSIQMEELARLHQRDHGLLAQVVMQNQNLTTLLEIQSSRLDRAEKEDRAAQKRHQEAQKLIERLQRQHEDLMQELRDRLDRIFDRLA